MVAHCVDIPPFFRPLRGAGPFFHDLWKTCVYCGLPPGSSFHSVPPRRPYKSRQGHVEGVFRLFP
jgi:hypothetical protein